MGIFVVIGMMLYSGGLCLLLQRVGQRSPDVRFRESERTCPAPSIVIPDRVPPEWVDAYRAEQGG
jgi:hypothetical protein